MIQLSKRLQAVADMVTKGNRVADIGCDHGYIAIHLIEAGRSPIVIAMDINRGPLEHANENIMKSGYADKILIRQSDGAKKLRSEEVDSVICAGMGGRLTIHIIQEDLHKMFHMKELILQPQSEIHLVRRFLKESGFTIVSESMIFEDGKYYPIMKAIPKDLVISDEQYDKDEISLYEYYGECLLKQKDETLLQYLHWKEKELDTITQQIIHNIGSKSIGSIRLTELTKEKEQIERALHYFKGE